MKKRIFIWFFGILLGLFLLFSLYGMFATEVVLRSYEDSFQVLEHPQDTSPLDSFKFKFSYYPATYADDSVKSRCAYLVGEIRSYSSNWDELKAFYKGKKLAHDNADEIYVGIFPIQLDPEGGVYPSFDLDSSFSYSPFDVDVLAKLESHYYFLGFPKGLGENENAIYAVYIAPACE